MTKNLRLEASSLTALNEALQKANYFSTKVISNPLKEAEDKYVSALAVDDTFDSDVIKSDDILVTDLTKEQQEKKTDLTQKIFDMLNDTLQANKEIYHLLNQVREINNQDKNKEWIKNEEDNTAILNYKNARIFIQNNNICLSHDGKIEIFKSVPELHRWLKTNNYPLPKNIQLHENLKEANVDDIRRKVLSKLTGLSNFNNREILGLPEKKNDLLNKYLADHPEAKEPQKVPEEKFHQSPRYMFLANVDGNYYFVNKNWNDKENPSKLLTKNEKLATIYPLESYAKKDFDNMIKSKGNIRDYLSIVTDNEAMQKVKGLEECGLGAAVTWLASKDKKEETEIEEDYPGFDDTLFKDQLYQQKRTRDNELLKYLNHRRFLDLDKEDSEELKAKLNKIENDAWSDYAAEELQSKLAKVWKGEIKKDSPFADFINSDKTINRNAPNYMEKINAINKEYGIDLHPNEDMWTISTRDPEGNKTFLNKISDHNDIQRKIWMRKQIEKLTGGFRDEHSKMMNVHLKRRAYENDYDKLKEYLQYYMQQIAAHGPGKEHDYIIQHLANELPAISKKFSKEDVKKAIQLITDEHALTKGKITDKDKELLSKYLESSINSNEQVLKEDDTPADFATGADIPNSADMSLNVDTNAEEMSSDDLNVNSDNLDDLVSNDASMGAPNNFGDINIDAGYGPDEEDAEQEVPVSQYKVIDVLKDVKNPSNIKVKLQDLNTNEIVVKDLDEIDL